ncbi:MAG: hypothetical protein HFI90_03745 [Clostridia bacterium]|nr:hypothetical protein [Clostridia bacterium]
MKRHAKRFCGILLLTAMLLAMIPAGFAAAAGVAMPTADVAPGLYRETKQVSLSAAAGATIYYSTDNKMPDETCTEYTGSITVSETTNICAIAVADGVKSDPVTFTYIIKDAEEPIFQFVAMSDIHIGDRTKDAPRVKKAFDVIQSIFPEPDAIVHVGDQINDNHVAHPEQPDRSADHQIVVDMLQKELQDRSLTDKTDVSMVMGNHDSTVSNMQKYYPEEWYPTSGPGYYHKVIDGYDFLFLNTESANQTQANWLSEKLLEITKNKTEMNKPIFVAGHRPLAGTVLDSQYAVNAPAITNVLAEYPQVVAFSGHSHINMNDEKSIHQKNYTSLNTGSMSYIEIDRGNNFQMHTNAGQVASFEIPVTQCYFVEVFSDRVEFDRVAVNADWGDARPHFIPSEPFNNTGVSIGERWTVDMTGDIKSKFQYTAEKRKGSAPTFAADAKVTAKIEGGKALVTFSQAEDVQKLRYYEVAMRDAAGNDVKSMKVLPEHYFSPVPRTLTYEFTDIPQFGGSYTFGVRGVDTFGNRSEAIVTEEAVTVPKLPGILPTYLVNETFTEEPTDAATQVMPFVDAWSGGQATINYNNGMCNLVNGGNTNFGLGMPLMPGDGTTATPTGPLMVEWEWKDATGAGEEIQAYFRNAAGQNSFVVRAYSGSYNCRFINASNGSGSNWGSSSAAGSNAMTKVRVLLNNTGSAAYVDGVWLNGTRIVSERQTFLRDVGAGFSKIIFSHKTNGSTGDTVFNIDNLKVWVPAASQAAKLAAEDGAAITFDDIKGTNEAANNITSDLALAAKTETTNGLIVTGWKSSNPAVIAADGTVTRPGLGEPDTEVTLTPILGVLDFENETDGNYATAEGTPITVTVKTTDTTGGIRPEDVNGVGYYVNETYDEKPTDPQTHSIPSIGTWSGGTAEWTVEDGKLAMVPTSTGYNFNIQIPFMPGEMKENIVPKGKVYIDFKWQHGANETQTDLYVQGYASNLVKLIAKSGKLEVAYYDASNKLQTYATSASGLNFNQMNQIKLLMDVKADGASTLEGFWLNGTEVKTGSVTLYKKTGTEDKDIERGPAGLVSSRWATTGTKPYKMLEFDYMKTWQPVEEQLAAKAAKATVTFDSIKGANTAADNVMGNLKLGGASYEIINGLSLVGWKSGNEAVIKADGTVVRPAYGSGDVQVALTPVFAMRNSENEDGVPELVKADGTPITVTVKEAGKPTDFNVTYLVNEDFDTLPTEADAATRPIPSESAWSGASATVDVADSAARLKLDGGIAKNTQMNVPVMPGAAASTMPRGKNMIEFEWKHHANATQIMVYLQGANGHVLRLEKSGTSTIIKKGTNGSAFSDVKTLSNQVFTTDTKVRLQIDTSTEGKTYLEQLWIGGTPKLDSRVELFDAGDGLKQLMFAPGNTTTGVGDIVCSVNYIKAWQSAPAQLAEYVAQNPVNVTFDNIKGENTAANNVTSNLQKADLGNGLKVVGWKTSNAAVVAADGTVTRPAKGSGDVQVTLTPMIGTEDITGEGTDGYISVDGTPITVTVKEATGETTPTPTETATPTPTPTSDTPTPTPVPGESKLAYFVNEPFDTLPTAADAATRPVPVVSDWGGKDSIVRVTDGAVQLVRGSKAANTCQLDVPLMTGTGTASMPRGENMIEFEWNRNSKSTQMAVYIKGSAGHAMKLNCTNNSMAIQSSQTGKPNAGEFTTLATVDNLNLGSGWTKVRLKINSTGTSTYLEQVWVNGEAKLSSKAVLFDVGQGLQQMMFSPGNGSVGAGEVIVSLNYLKTWQSAASQIAELSQGAVTFNDIKGTNTAADAVTANLDFSKTEIGDFRVQGWKSSNEDIIAADGSVTRPLITQNDAQVVLTPILGMADTTNEGDGTWVYGDGAPLTVTVKKMGAADAVARVKAELSFDDIKGINTAADSVTDNLDFIRELNGVNIQWSVQSMTPSTTTAKVDGATGMVVRPQMNESDVTVVLRAALTCEGASDTKDITVTLKKLDVSAEEYLRQLADSLTFAEIAGDNKAENRITANLHLIPSFKGAQVTWQSSQPQTVAADGSVTRPDYPQPSAEVQLTATLQMEGAQPVTKVFRVVVLSTDSDNLALEKTVKVNVAADGDTKAANLTDGDRDTTFRTKAGAKAYTVTINLGSETPFSSLDVYEVANGDGVYAIEAYTVDISNDGKTWKTVATGGTIGLGSTIAFDPVIAQYVRLNVTKKKSGVASELAEIAVRLQPTEAQRVKADIENLMLDLPDTITANSITLPAKGAFGSDITWTFTPEGIIAQTGTPDGNGNMTYAVTHPQNGQRVTLVATAKSGAAAAKKNFNRSVSGTATNNGGGAGNSGGGSGSASGGSGSGGGKMPNVNLGDLSGVGTPSGANKPSQEGFRDMEQDAWAIPYVMKLYTRGVVQGDENGNFRPAQSVNREEFVKMLVLALDVPESEADIAFADMEQGAWYRDYIQAAVAAGIVKGVSEERFGVGETITREDMATMIYRAVTYLKQNIGNSEHAATITDAQDISSYAQEAVSALVRGGVISGNEAGEFLPKNQSTRAEAAKMLAMLMQ